MKKPVLVIMAAGMGSRYGGLKQIDPVDEQGHIIIDFSIFDAIRAGFEKVVFIIKKANEKDFMEAIGNRIAKQIQVEYVFQELDHIPQKYEVPQDRQKPWGTGHAILCCKDVVKEPFAVINADDYYGPKAFQMIYDYLSTHEDDSRYRYTMVGYVLENTLTENGHVARGVCTVSPDGYLQEIHERTQIEKHGEDSEYTEDGGKTWVKLPKGSTVSMNMWGFTPSIFPELEKGTQIEKHGEDSEYTEDGGKTWVKLPKGSTVSMNMWGFTPSIFPELEKGFDAFLEEALEKNPLKGEFFLPSMIEQLLQEDKATVSVLKSQDRWYGVTYREDKPVVMEAIKRLKKEGLYPENLYE